MGRFLETPIGMVIKISNFVSISNFGSLNGEVMIKSSDPLTVMNLISTYDYWIEKISFTSSFLNLRTRPYNVDKILKFREATERDISFLDKYYLAKYDYFLPNFDYVIRMKVSDIDGFWTYSSDFPDSVILTYTLLSNKEQRPELQIVQEKRFCKSCKTELLDHNKFYCDICYNFSKQIYEEENKGKQNV